MADRTPRQQVVLAMPIGKVFSQVRGDRLPEETQCVAARVQGDTIEFICEDASFDEVAIGEPTPVIE